MNIKQLLPAALLALAAATSSCVNDTEELCPPATGGTTGTEDPEPGVAGVVKFALPAIDSRLSYDDFSTVFTPGEKVGCVIFKEGDWGEKSIALLTIWRVNKNNYLELEQVKTKDSWTASSQYKDVTADNNDYICRFNQQEGQEKVKAEYVFLKNNMNYAFHFYYPLVKVDDMKDDIFAAIDRYNSDGTPVAESLSYPNLAQSRYNYTDHVTGPFELKFGVYGNRHSLKFDLAAASQYNHIPIDQFIMSRVYSAEIDYQSFNSAACYGGDSYPTYVSVNQQTEKALHNSDFMLGMRSRDDDGNPITPDNPNTTLNVTFVKQHAAIDIISEDDISNLHLFYSAEEATKAWTPNVEWTGFLMGRFYNFTTGEYTVKPVTMDNGFGREYVSHWPEEIYPCEMEPGKRFRVILPPQEVGGQLLFTDAEGKDYSIDLANLIKVPALESNKLYIIRLRKGFADVIIQDWIFDQSGSLEEVKNEVTEP